MKNLHPVTKSVQNLIGIVRSTKRAGRMFALFIMVAVVTATAFSLPSSAKLIENLFGTTPPASATFKQSALGAPLTPAEEVPVITTDKSSYEPGETITFTGANWTPGETIRVAVRAGAVEGEEGMLEATADEKGTFVLTAIMPGGEEHTSAAAKAASVSASQKGGGADKPVAAGKKGGVAAKSAAAGKNGGVADKAASASSGAAPASQGDGTIYTVVATGSTSGASAQTQFKENGRPDDGEEDDADIPRFMIGKINKEDYLRRRQEHVDRLRGIERGRPFDPSARGRAIRQMEQQTGKPDKNTITNETWSAASTGTSQEASAAPGDFNGAMSALSLSNSSWLTIGPAPIPNGQTSGVTHAVSGRVTSIAIHPVNSDIVYVGAAQGGVYRTLDGGANWTPIFDNAQSLAIGSIAVSPSQPSTIYVGTGEGNYSGDTFFGVGVYRVDNADSPNPVLTGPFNLETGTGNDVLTGRSISKVLVHPTNPDIIFLAVNNSGIGGIGGSAHPTQNSSRGVYRSTNATSSNATFQKLATNTANSGNRSATDLEFEPGNPNVLLATIVGFSTAGDGGVYRSTNALAANPTFTQTLSIGTTSATARGELTINKVGNAVTVYVASTDANGTVKRSTDGGLNWSAALSSATGFCGSQCFYDMPIAVDPNNANILFIGGNAGESGAPAIIKKSTNALSTASFVRAQTGLHADSQAVEFDPTNSSVIWTGNDGGVWKSTDGAASWTSLNNTGFNATQFQSVAVHPTDKNFSIGGTQDNGTQRVRTDGTWTRTDYGDGGFALIDQSATGTTSVRQYHTYWNAVGQGNIVGFATTTSPTAFENWTFLGCGGTANGLTCNDSAVLFYAPMALGPGTPNTLYFGTDKLYRSINSGSTMTAVSQVLASGVAVSAIGISRQNDAVRIVGLENGKVFRTMNGSTTLTDVTGTIPARYVSRAVIDPTNTNTAYVTLSGFFGNSTPHIYKTTNLNAASPTWTGLGNNIPDIPVNAFVIDPSNPNMLYAGTDIGVYRSTDAGANWVPFSNGLARVAVFDMAIQDNHRILRIATHGRGMWEISLNAPVNPGTLQGAVTDSATGGPVSGATVTAGSNTTTTNANGFYVFGEIEPGTYNVTASAPGYNNSPSAVATVTSDNTTTQNFALTPAPASGCLTDTTQADFDAGVKTNVDTSTTPGDVKLAAGGASLDQQMTNTSTSGNAITTTTWQAQTFIPGTSGRLMQVDAGMFCSSCSGVNPDLTFEVRTVSGGVPTTTVLATATVPGFSSGTSQYYAAMFSNPASLTAGTTYAIVSRLTTTRTGTYAWLRSTNNQYANGAQLTTTNSGGAWSAQSTDLAFKTYMSAGYTASGDLTSSTKDSNPASGVSPNWTTLSWTANTPAGTTVRFQAAASNSATGPFSFVGPDGTASTYFTASGASLSQFNGRRYLKYKAYLSTTNSGATPTLGDVTACFQNGALPATTTTVSSASGTYGGTTPLTATLNSGGSPLSGKLITFTLNGAGVGSATTNSNGVATLTNASLSGINAGSYPNGVGASFSPDGSHAGSSGSNSLTVNKATPTLTWSNPANITYGTPLGASQLNATASVPGSFVYTPASGTVLGAGNNQTLRADFTPTDSINYNTASKDVSINVTKSSLTVKADNGSRAYGDANPTFTYTMTGFAGTDTQANSTTGQPAITTTADSTSAPGSYTITAAAGTLGAANYTFSFVNGTLTVSKANQTITFGALETKTYGDDDFTVNASASSGLTVTLTASGKCTISGSTVHITGAGACNITATQAGNANYNAAADASQSFTINKAGSTTTVTVGNATYDGNTHGGNAVVTGAGGLNQSLPVTYSGRNGTTYGPSTTAPTDAGDYTASASFGGGADHNASSDSEEFQISKAASTTVVTFEDAPYVYRGSAYTATAQANGAGGLNAPVTVVYSGDCTNVTTADGCTATATYQGDANHEGGSDSKSITITKATATIALGDLLQTYNGAPRVATATTNPNNLGGVTITYDGSTTAPTGAGSYPVLASLNNQNYQADNATGTLEVGKATPTVEWSNPADIVYGTALGASQLNATASVSGSFAYTPVSGTVLNAGDSQTLRAEFTPGDTANYNGVSKDVSINVAQASQAIAFGALANKTYGDAPFNVSATGGASGNPVTFNAAGNCTASGTNGSTITITGAGNCTVTASQGGNTNYTAALDVARSFQIAKAAATITLSNLYYLYDGTAKSATAATDPSGLSGVTINYTGVTLSYNSTTSPTAAGTYTATATLANANYAAPNAAGTFVINAAPSVTINAPAGGALYLKGSTVSFTGAFIDNPGTHTATWTFTSGTQTITQAATVNEATGAINATYTFPATGVYTVKLTVSDNFGVTGVATTVGGVTGASALIAVYDSSSTGGSVSTTTKSPLYNSLAGWYPANPALTGTATTGFNAAYPSATATAPTGQAVFNLPAANLSFVSAGYQWLVVTKPYVWLRGSGTVNNVSGHEFLIAAVDGQLTGGGGTDKFRIRIWRKSDGVVIYDNIPGGALNAVATTVTSNGDIAIK